MDKFLKIQFRQICCAELQIIYVDTLHSGRGAQIPAFYVWVAHREFFPKDSVEVQGNSNFTVAKSDKHHLRDQGQYEQW